MCAQREWDLNQPDLLHNFFARLPDPSGGIAQQHVENRKGGRAELFIFRYEPVDPLLAKLWHGSHPGALQNVLREGFKDSSNPEMHEFSVPGIYTSTDALDTLEPYAVSTQFKKKWSWDTPWVKVVLLVQSERKYLRKRGSEEVYRASDVKLKEVHVLRGFDFKSRADKYTNLTEEDEVRLLFTKPIRAVPHEEWPQPWSKNPSQPHTVTVLPKFSFKSCTNSPERLCLSAQPPSPPPVQWTRYWTPNWRA